MDSAKLDFEKLTESLTNDLVPLAAARPPNEQTKASDALDALVRYIPTETVTLYVAASAALPSLKSSLGATELIVYWSFAVLTAVLFLLIFAGKRRSAGMPALPSLGKWPWWKLIASAIAFMAWGLALPSSPYLTGEAGKVVAAFAALLVSTFLSLGERVVEAPSST